MSLTVRNLLLTGILTLMWAQLSLAQLQGNSAFIENKGQIKDQFGVANTQVLAAYFGESLDFFIRKDGFSYQLKKVTPGVNDTSAPELDFHRMDVTYYNSSTNPEISFEDPLSDVENFICSENSKRKEITGVHSFKRILCRNIFPGIDVEFVMNEDVQSNYPVKFNFILESSAAMDLLKLHYAGAENVSLKSNGLQNSSDLILKTSLGELKETVPFSYRQSQLGDREIKVDYKLNADGILGFQFRNELDQYASGRVIIDPMPNLHWSTYYGGSNSDVGTVTVFDPSGFVLMAGTTSSASQIATVGAYQTVFGGNSTNDMFIAKFDLLGNRQWATYVGGPDDEQVWDLYIDGSSNIYFAGNSLSATGVSTAGAYQAVKNSGSDAVLGKLSPAGAMQWCTYFGGNQNESIRNIEVRGLNVYVTGNTNSTNVMATPGAYQASFGGGSNDVFISQFDSNGNLIWSTYYGGLLNDVSAGISLDGLGNLFVGGNTNSTSSIATAGSYQPALAGASDGMLACFTTGGFLQWATYFGGTGIETVSSMTTNSAGELILSGQTYSTAGVATAGAFDVSLSGSNDAYIQVFSHVGNKVWGTYFGGTSTEFGYTINTDAFDNIYLAGFTGSSGLATVGVSQTSYGGGSLDGYITQFNAAGVQQWASYFGGPSDDYIRSIALDISGAASITGNSLSTSGIATAGAFQTTPGSVGTNDAFLANFNGLTSLPITILSFSTSSDYDRNEVNCLWEVSSDAECAMYSVQKSIDGLNWTDVGWMTCDDHRDTYSLRDVQPDAGRTYYQLMRINENQDVSETRLAVNFFNQKSECVVFPNPAKDDMFVSISSDTESTCHLEIVNALGQIVFTSNQNLAQGSTTWMLDIRDLPAGNYKLHILSQDGRNLVRSVIIE